MFDNIYLILSEHI